jgi:uncharacterized membrane protein
MRTSAIIFALVTYLVLDLIYISLIGKYFQNQIIDVQRVKLTPNYYAANACYVFIMFAFYYFILRPQKTPFDAAILGLALYGVFELTNFALFKKWRIETVVIDTLWGGLALSLATFITYRVYGFSFDLAI